MGWESDPKKGPDIKKLREQLGFEQDQHGAREAPENAEARAHPDLVAKYSSFKEAVGFDTGVVYHPCSSRDISPSEVFPGSRVVYADMDADAMAAVRAKGLEAHVADVSTFNPGPVDVLILLNPQIDPDVPSSHVKEGGFIVCNDYHNTATHLREHGLVPLAIIRGTRDGFVYDTEPDLYWEEVETDEEFKNAPPSFGGASYDSAAHIVSIITGASSNIVSEYKKIIESIRKGTLDGIENVNDSKRIIFADYKGEHLMIPTRLAKKKGVVDDLFVFRKEVAQD